MLGNKLSTNMDTNFLKMVAIIAMVVDHVGKVFFPDLIVLQIIGRIAFPIFAYCIIVGVLYTSNFQKYLTRLGLFAVISQIPWVLAFNPTMQGFIENWMSLNIFFTLFFSAIFVKGMKDKQWVYLIVALVAFSLFPLDYGFDTLFLLASLYLLRNHKLASCIVTTLILLIPFFTGGDVAFLGMMIDIQGLACLAVPFIYSNTHVNLNINKYFFYSFYPVHLLLIFLVEVFMMQ